MRGAKTIVERFVSGENYYDLIRLPGGAHIPAPVAIERVGLENVKKNTALSHVARR